MRTSRASPSHAVLFHEYVALCWSTLQWPLRPDARVICRVQQPSGHSAQGVVIACSSGTCSRASAVARRSSRSAAAAWLLRRASVAAHQRL